jgi:thiamine biosynthesis lipoprotein
MPASGRDLVRRAQPWLGTLVEVRVDAAGAARRQLTTIVDAAFAEIGAIHRLMSRQERGTDVAAIARAGTGRSVRVDPRTADVLRVALALYHESGGRYDPDRSRRRRGALDPAPCGPAWEVSGRDHVRILRRGDLDLDGIAKGFAVDRAVDILAGESARGGVNAGGDLRCFGEFTQPLFVRSPLAGGALLCVGRMTAGSFATSDSRAEADSGPRPASPGIRDPRPGARPLRRMTVGVAAEQCIVADALTKVVAVAPEAASPILAAYGASAWIVDERQGMPRVRRCGSSAHVQTQAA